MVSPLSCSRVNLVGCCVQSLIGSRLMPQLILFYLFVCPLTRWTKGCGIVLPHCDHPARSLSNYIPSLRSTFGWLLHPPIQWKPSKLKVPLLSLFLIFVAAFDPPKQWVNVLPHMFLLVTSPLPCPPPTPLCHR